LSLSFRSQSLVRCLQYRNSITVVEFSAVILDIRLSLDCVVYDIDCERYLDTASGRYSGKIDCLTAASAEYRIDGDCIYCTNNCWCIMYWLPLYSHT